VRLLLQAGALLDPVDDFNRTPFHLACLYGWPQIAQLLLANGADLENTDTFGKTPLLSASFWGHFDVVEPLIEQNGADIFARDKCNKTAYDVASGSSSDLIRRFIFGYFESSYHGSIHNILRSTSYHENSVTLPFGVVSFDSMLGLLRTLVERAPNTTLVRDQAGDLPIHVACRAAASLPALHFLMDQDDSCIHKLDGKGSSPIHICCEAGASLREIRFLLLDKIRVPDHNGRLPLHLYCASGRATNDTVSFLVEQDPTILHIRENDGALPIHKACEAGSPTDVINFLLARAPASVSAQTVNGDFPITLACEKGSLETIYLLLRAYPQVIS